MAQQLQLPLTRPAPARAAPARDVGALRAALREIAAAATGAQKYAPQQCAWIERRARAALGEPMTW